MLKKTISLSICLSSYLFGVSALLQNKGIVDIGRTSSLTEVEVPMEYVYSDGARTTVDNVVIYNDRIQSDLFDCEHDFLGTETCPIDKAECPSFEQFADGYSTIHHTIKSFSKICPAKTVKINNKCYLDDDENTVPDNKRVTDYSYQLNRSASPYAAGYGGSYNIPVGTYSDNFVIQNAGDYDIYFGGDDDGWAKLDNAEIVSQRRICCGYTQHVKKYLNTGVHNLNYAAWDSAGGAWWVGAYIVQSDGQVIWNSRDGQVTTKINCPSGFTPEGDACVTNTVCQAYTSLQSDGTCRMEYDWYSYHCASDLNDYANSWQIRNSGSDCGHPTCTNSATPPANNCVRVSYSCPLDPNAKCGKTTVSNVDCGEGYVWNDNRCERIEAYCGSSTYNATLDICQDVTHHGKLCVNPTDIYDVNLNKCVGSAQICQDGEYDWTNKVCHTSFEARCTSAGYTYDVSTQSCINNAQNICDPQYHYIASQNICKGEMTVCATGETYNATLKVCEKNSCGILGTIDKNGRCETSALCDGVLTSTGKCQPNTVQQ